MVPTNAMVSSMDIKTAILLASSPETPPLTESPAAAALTDETNVAVFVVGLIPFAWATIEFWRRIAVGASFGTGDDSVVIIGDDDNPTSSRGRRVLGKGALVVAYVLFGIAAATVAIAVYSVVSSDSVSRTGGGAPLVDAVSGGMGL